jgi:CheY-like chemotaxis protein
MSSPLSTVLVVDDDPMLRYLLARTLADEGYPVIAVENGEQALILASSLIGQLALVITDIRMPGMGGLQLARCLANLEVPPPVLFISGFAADAEVPGPFLAKPFLPQAPWWNMSAGCSRSFSINSLRTCLALPRARTAA